MGAQRLQPTVDVHRARDRFVTTTPWLNSAHSFSFGQHYDGRNTSHGLLLANNDDVVQPGAGFDPHPHRDMEIVTWVLQGSLVHRDSTGRCGVVYPGLAQRMSAGSGIVHSEKNDARLAHDGIAPDGIAHDGIAHDVPVHFVQMWVVPDESGIVPGYEQLEVNDALLPGDLMPVASGMTKHDGAAAIRLHNRHAALHVARLRPGQSMALPDAPYVHGFLTRGTVHVEEVGVLRTGDAVRLTGTGGHRMTATQPAEILVWEMHAGLAA